MICGSKEKLRKLKIFSSVIIWWRNSQQTTNRSTWASKIGKTRYQSIHRSVRPFHLSSQGQLSLNQQQIVSSAVASKVHSFSRDPMQCFIAIHLCSKYTVYRSIGQRRRRRRQKLTWDVLFSFKETCACYDSIRKHKGQRFITFWYYFYTFYFECHRRDFDSNLDQTVLLLVSDESDVQGVRGAGSWIPFRRFHVRGLQGELPRSLSLCPVISVNVLIWISPVPVPVMDK